jgi:hypothetical protein
MNKSRMSETSESDDFTCDCQEYGFKGRGHNEECMGITCKGSYNPMCLICNYLLARKEYCDFENPTNTEFLSFESIITITECMFCNGTFNCITIYDYSGRIGNRHNKAYPKYIIELYRETILNNYKELLESVQYCGMACFEKVKRPTSSLAYMCETCILINEAMNNTQLENKVYRFRTCEECDFCNSDPLTQCICLKQEEYMEYCSWLFNDTEIESYMDPKIRQPLQLYFQKYIDHIDNVFNKKPEHDLTLPE